MWSVLLCLGPPASALAGNTGVGQELHGVRSMAMGGAHRGLGTSNDTLYLNPAGMAIMRRYSVELQYGYSPFDHLNHINASAVDSKSGPVAGAIGYTHDRGDKAGVNANLHRIIGGAAYPINQRLAFGLSTRHVRGHFNDADGKRHDVRLYSGDVGVMALVTPQVGLGVAYNNIVATDFPELTPPSAGLGLSFLGPLFTLAGDISWDLKTPKDAAVSYHLGGEYIASRTFPLRLGYRRETFVRNNGENGWENQITAGAGWSTVDGGLDLAYSRSLERRRHWSLIAAFRFSI